MGAPEAEECLSRPYRARVLLRSVDPGRRSPGGSLALGWRVVALQANRDPRAGEWWDVYCTERPGSPTPGQRCSIDNRDALPALAGACGSVPAAPTGRDKPAQGKPRVREGRRPGWDAQTKTRSPNGAKQTGSRWARPRPDTFRKGITGPAGGTLAAACPGEAIRNRAPCGEASRSRASFNPGM